MDKVLLHFFKSGFGSTFSEALAPPFPKVDKGGKQFKNK